MKKISLVFLVLSVLIFSCKKKVIEPIPEDNYPVFTLDGEFGGEAIHYSAGDDGMVMTGDIEMRNGVDYAFGEFSNGTTKFKLGVYDGRVALPGIHGNIAIGDTLFFAKKRTESLAFLSPSMLTSGPKINNVDWYANAVFLGSNNVNIYEPGVYDICGEFTFDDNSTETICNKMILGFENDVDVSVRHFLNETGELNLWLEGNLNGLDSVRWYFDNEFQWTGETCTKNIDYEPKVVTAHVFYANGADIRKSIRVDGAFNGHWIDDFSVFQLETTEGLWDYTVGLEVERNGQSFSTFNVTNYKGYFLVKGVSYYVHPITSEPMVRVSAEIDAKLKSSTGAVVTTTLDVVVGLPRIN
jgi:hypothetical protein